MSASTPNIFVPRRHVTRTPYGAIGDPKVLWSNPNVQALAPDGYVIVYQDIRGRFGSEGHFVMFRQPAEETASTGPSTTTTPSSGCFAT